MTATYWLERAWLGAGDVVDSVLVTVDDDRFTGVAVGSPAPVGARKLSGLSVPGLANCHSHAFHRALRGRTQRGRGSFWTWREQMYDAAARLDPSGYYELARATYREMVLAGYTTVGEFHYLHHGPDGRPYDDPNAMGAALVEAARDAGIRIALLDACYLTAGIGEPPDGVQKRFSDGNAEQWANRVERMRYAAGDGVVVGAAVHSIRAVPPAQMRIVARWAAAHDVPVHLHLSEQVAENDACQAAFGCSPTELVEQARLLSERTTVVHATHLSARDIEILGGRRVFACFCPTTERDLGDGIGRSRRLRRLGARLTVGSDSHAVVDPFEELRAVEMNERLRSRERGHWKAVDLLKAGTGNGHRSLGFTDVGRIEVGARADLVTLDLASPRTAGAGASVETAVFAATAADVVQVMRDGRVLARADRLDEERASVGRDLEAAIAKLWAS